MVRRWAELLWVLITHHLAFQANAVQRLRCWKWDIQGDASIEETLTGAIEIFNGRQRHRISHMNAEYINNTTSKQKWRKKATFLSSWHAFDVSGTWWLADGFRLPSPAFPPTVGKQLVSRFLTRWRVVVRRLRWDYGNNCSSRLRMGTGKTSDWQHRLLGDSTRYRGQASVRQYAMRRRAGFYGTRRRWWKAGRLQKYEVTQNRLKKLKRHQLCFSAVLFDILLVKLHEQYNTWTKKGL